MYQFFRNISIGTSEVVDDRSPSSPPKEEPASKTKESSKKDEVASERGQKDTSPSKPVSCSTSPGIGRPHRSCLSEQLSRPPTTLSRVSGPTSLSASKKLDQQAQSAPQQPPQQLPQRESGELLVGSDVLLIDAQGMKEKEDVGLEIDGSEDNLSKLSLIEGSAQLDKELNTSNLEGGSPFANYLDPHPSLPYPPIHPPTHLQPNIYHTGLTCIFICNV